MADELVDGTPAHFLIGLNMYSGAVLLDQAVDPPGQAPAAILQRTGLNLSDGNVVFGYGGNYGDCSTYHGYIVAVPESGGPLRVYNTTANGTQGAVWMGGAAPEVDSAGNIWASSGNGSSSNPYDGSDSVFELSPSLTQEQLFAPSEWSSDNANDRDLGSTAPALLSNGTVVQVGKSQTDYLLSQSSLGGIGGQLATATVCNGADADGGDAVLGSVAFVPCENGLEALQTSTAPLSITPLWTFPISSPGPPIVAGGLVWTIEGSILDGNSTLDRLSGGVVRTGRAGQPLPHAVGGRRPTPRHERRPGVRLRRLSRDASATELASVGTPRTRPTGKSRLTAASSPSATPPSTAPWAASR